MAATHNRYSFYTPKAPKPRKTSGAPAASGPAAAASTGSTGSGTAALTPDQIAALVLTDPRYLMGMGPINAAKGQSILGYGDLSQLDPGVLDKIGATPEQVAAAAANPYSTTAGLTKQHAALTESINNAMNAHGLTFSGIRANQQNNEVEAAKQRLYGANQAFTSYLNSLSGQQSNLWQSIYGAIAANPPAISGTAPATGPAAGTVPTPGSTGPTLAPVLPGQDPGDQLLRGGHPTQFSISKPPKPKVVRPPGMRASPGVSV